MTHIRPLTLRGADNRAYENALLEKNALWMQTPSPQLATPLLSAPNVFCGIAAPNWGGAGRERLKLTLLELLLQLLAMLSFKQPRRTPHTFHQQLCNQWS